MSTTENFRDAMRRAGLDCCGEIIADGKLHRFHVGGDRPGSRNGWFVVHVDPPACGVFGTWKDPDAQHKWRGCDNQRLSPAEGEAFRRRMVQVEAERKRADTERRDKARKVAAEILSRAGPPAGNGYLQRKGVKPFGELQQDSDKLVVPLRDAAGTLHSLQFIEPDGSKIFLSGGRVAGCFFTLTEKPDGPLVIAEGYATGASIAEATGFAVVTAMDCGNLLAVAKALREKWPAREIIIAGDHDQWTNGNPGLTKATDAAKAIGARLAVARFADTATKPTDFNDLAKLEGLGTVKTQIESATVPKETAWPEPKALPDDLPAVEAFNYECLPGTLRPWVEDIAERMQCPPDYPAVGAIVALGSLIGRKVGIRPKRHDDWLLVANLWGMVIGRPGLLKTPALEQALSPINRLAAEAKTKYNAEQKEHDVSAFVDERRAKLFEKEVEKLLKDGHEAAAREKAKAIVAGEKQAPVERRYIINDSTVEKLGELLNQNPNGLLLHRDELVGFLRSLDKEGHEEWRAFYLESWNGTGSFTYDRIARGTVSIECNTVSIIGAIQPGPLSDYLRQAVRSGVGDDGLLQRFQVDVWPDTSKDWLNVDRWPDSKAKKEAFAVFQYLDTLSAAAVGADCSEGIPFLHFESDAQARFDQWRAELEQRLRSDCEHPAFEAHLSKYRKLIPAIALILHLANRDTGPVTLAAFEKALLWARYLESHARRIYSAVLRPDSASARELAKHLKKGDLADKFTLRETYRKGWTGLGSKEDAEAATEILCELGWIRSVRYDGPANGRPASPTFEVNPTVRNPSDEN